jgi:hypothetical protein
LIAERPDFSHPVRNEDDGHALALEAGDQVAKPIDVSAREGRGRLVEQDQARLTEDSAGDLDFLLHREVEIADFGVEVGIKSE